MTGLFSRLPLRAAIGLIAAYAVALQTVFITLAPIPALAAGPADPFAHCFGLGNSGTPDQPGLPSPAADAMHCVFCGACAAGFVVLPPAAADVVRQTAAMLVFLPPAATGLAVASHARDGPARAPPLTT
jgi:hypothetical protein